MAWKTKTILMTAAGALAGCAGPADVSISAPGGPDEIEEAVDRGGSAKQAMDDLQMLRSLEIAEVGELLHQYPEGAFNCYGACPEFEDEIAAEDSRQAQRLSLLADIAFQKVTIEADEAFCGAEVIDDNLAALADLQIVEVFGLVEEVPQNNPYCYNLPCPDDIAAAEAINCQRATALAAIAQEAEDL
jgi:hypothetical protein